MKTVWLLSVPIFVLVALFLARSSPKFNATPASPPAVSQTTENPSGYPQRHDPFRKQLNDDTLLFKLAELVVLRGILIVVFLTGALGACLAGADIRWLLVRGKRYVKGKTASEKLILSLIEVIGTPLGAASAVLLWSPGLRQSSNVFAALIVAAFALGIAPWLIQEAQKKNQAAGGDFRP